jgi:hypothetical protein
MTKDTAIVEATQVVATSSEKKYDTCNLPILEANSKFPIKHLGRDFDLTNATQEELKWLFEKKCWFVKEGK